MPRSHGRHKYSILRWQHNIEEPFEMRTSCRITLAHPLFTNKIICLSEMCICLFGLKSSLPRRPNSKIDVAAAANFTRELLPLWADALPSEEAERGTRSQPGGSGHFEVHQRNGISPPSIDLDIQIARPPCRCPWAFELHMKQTKNANIIRMTAILNWGARERLNAAS